MKIGRLGEYSGSKSSVRSCDPSGNVKENLDIQNQKCKERSRLKTIT